MAPPPASALRLRRHPPATPQSYSGCRLRTWTPSADRTPRSFSADCANWWLVPMTAASRGLAGECPPPSRHRFAKEKRRRCSGFREAMRATSPTTAPCTGRRKTALPLMRSSRLFVESVSLIGNRILHPRPIARASRADGPSHTCRTTLCRDRDRGNWRVRIEPDGVVDRCSSFPGPPGSRSEKAKGPIPSSRMFRNAA